MCLNPFWCFPTVRVVSVHVLFAFPSQGGLISDKAAGKVPGGHMLPNRIINVAPDGRYASACVVAAFNVIKYENVKRKPSGYAESRAVVMREEHEVKEFLLGKACEALEHGKEEWSTWFEHLANGDSAEKICLKLLARSIGHRIIAEGVLDRCQILGKPQWPYVLWATMSSATTKGTSSCSSPLTLAWKQAAQRKRAARSAAENEKPIAKQSHKTSGALRLRMLLLWSAPALPSRSAVVHTGSP